MIYVLTSAFSNATQISACLERFGNVKKKQPYQHFLVSGHYPLNYTKNEARIKELAKIFKLNYLNPKEDLGSAQTQVWAMNEIGLNMGDYVVNLDPDSACDVPNWLDAMYEVLEKDEPLAMVHLTNPYVWERIRFRYHPFTFREVAGHKLAVPMAPEQFNITMFRVSALDALGGLLQGSPLYGNLEGQMWQGVRELGLGTAYLTEIIEAYDLKPLEDEELYAWKMAHCHNERFNVPYFEGKFGEYCKLKNYA